MTWKRIDYESFKLYEIIPKSNARGSYKYRDKGLAGNPVSIYPDDFCPLKKIPKIKMPRGTTAKLQMGDQESANQIRKQAKQFGVPNGCYQLRRAYGGPGRMNEFKKAQLTQLKGKLKIGTKVVIKEFWVY